MIHKFTFCSQFRESKATRLLLLSVELFGKNESYWCQYWLSKYRKHPLAITNYPGPTHSLGKNKGLGLQHDVVMT